MAASILYPFKAFTLEGRHGKVPRASLRKLFSSTMPLPRDEWARQRWVCLTRRLLGHRVLGITRRGPQGSSRRRRPVESHNGPRPEDVPIPWRLLQ